MRIAIIGAGFTGLTAAYELLKKGHSVVVFEKDNTPGGLAIGYKEKEWDWTLEAFYHHWFTNDKAVLHLADEIHYPVLTRLPKTSSLIDGKIYQLDSPKTFLTFPKLSFFERLRMITTLGFLRLDPFWKPLEKVTADTWLPKAMGKKAYALLWYPLLHNKFGNYTKDISLAWFWARIVKRTPSLSYPEGGFLRFAKALDKKVREMGGEIMYGTSVEKIEEKNGKITVGKFGIFDKAIVTLPSFIFTKLAPQLPENYKEKLLHLKGLGAVVLVARFSQPFFTDGTYWLNVCDTSSPILAVVEHTNFMDAKKYNNEHIVYLGNYLPSNHKYFSMSEKEIMKEFDPFLEKIHPGYKKSLITVRKFSVPFAQPIIPVNYSKMVPSFETPLKNVYLANMQQVYPWDRGTNYAVQLGQKIAGIVINK